MENRRNLDELVESIFNNNGCANSTKEGVRDIIWSLSRYAENGLGENDTVFPPAKIISCGWGHRNRSRACNYIKKNIGYDIIAEYLNKQYGSNFRISYDGAYNNGLSIISIEDITRLEESKRQYKEAEKIAEVLDEDNHEHILNIARLLNLKYENPTNEKYMEIWNRIPEWREVSQDIDSIGRAVIHWASYRMDKLRAVGYIDRY